MIKRLQRLLLDNHRVGLFSLLTFAAVFIVLGLLMPAQGLTDDDDFYAPAAESYAGWLGDALTSPGQAFSKKGIDRAFKPNHEHPPVAKFVMGLSQAVFSKGLPLFNSLNGARLGVVFFAALLCALLLAFLWNAFSKGEALFAVMALLCMPRFFFHAQVATLDVPVAAMVTAVAVLYFWSETRPKLWWVSGVVFGLALLTKLNAPFAAIPATLFVILSRFRGMRFFSGQLQFPPVPRSLFAMAIMGPLLFLALWPWLWFDTFARLQAYFAFHLSHYPILLFFQGAVYSKPFAPFTMPFTMAAGVIPLPILILGLLGTLSSLQALWTVVRAPSFQEVSLRKRMLAFIFLQAFFAIGIVAFSNVPKYGGAKLFMPFFPFFAMLSAEGFRLFVESLRSLHAAPFLKRPLMALLLAALCLLPGAYANVHFFGGFALSYYSEIVGGLPGATARGYERMYYDIADKELAHWLEENTEGKRVHFEPNHKEYVRTYKWLKRDGVIAAPIVLERNEKRATYLVLMHERRWRSYPSLEKRYRAYERVYEKRIDNVLLYTVYRKR